MRLLPFLGLVFAVLIGPASARPTAEDLRPLARRLAVEIIRPAYADLAARARAAVDAWDEVCRTSAPARARLVEAHRATARAWWRIEAVRFEPVSEDFRAERIDFWPDRRNATTRGLAGLLDPAAPEPTAAGVRAASAAVQGLPALERLIFDRTGPLSPRECAAGRAIAANVATLTREIEAGWAPLTEKVGGDEAAAREMVARLTTDVLGEFENLLDGKLAPLGKTPETARPDGFEGRRAGLERDALVEPLVGVTAILRGLLADRAGGETILLTLETAISIGEPLPERLGPLLADPRRRASIVLLRDAIRAARDVAASDLPALLGVAVGFNSRDGD